MRGQRLGLAVVLAAGGVGGRWIWTSGPDPAQTVRVEAPPSQPTDGQPAWFTDPSAPAPPVGIEELVRQVTDSLAGRPLCEAPPVELTEDQKREIERTLSTAPIPPTVPTDTPGAVINIHRRLVPC